MPGVLGGSLGGEPFLKGEVPLYGPVHDGRSNHVSLEGNRSGLGCLVVAFFGEALQGYLTDKETHHPRTLPPRVLDGCKGVGVFLWAR